MDELLRAHTTPQRFCEDCSDTDANDEGGFTPPRATHLFRGQS